MIAESWAMWLLTSLAALYIGRIFVRLWRIHSIRRDLKQYFHDPSKRWPL